MKFTKERRIFLSLTIAALVATGVIFRKPATTLHSLEETAFYFHLLASGKPSVISCCVAESVSAGTALSWQEETAFTDSLADLTRKLYPGFSDKIFSLEFNGTIPFYAGYHSFYALEVFILQWRFESDTTSLLLIGSGRSVLSSSGENRLICPYVVHSVELSDNAQLCVFSVQPGSRVLLNEARSLIEGSLLQHGDS